jgi:porin
LYPPARTSYPPPRHKVIIREKHLERGGYYDLTTSNASVPAFVGLHDEWGVEAFYNIAVTPWAQVTPDIQYIDGARGLADPAWIMGLRLKIVF